MKPVLLSCTLAMLWHASSVGAATIANYNFDSRSLNSADSDLLSDADPFVISFGTGASTTSTAGGTAYVFSNRVAGTPTTPGDETAAITLDRYFAFTVRPIAGQKLDFTSIIFDIKFDSSVGSATWFVRSSADSYSQTLGSFVAPVSTVDTPITPSSPISLASMAQATGDVTFRLYLFDDQDSGSLPHRLDNVILEADVLPVPEPASLVLAVMGAAMIARRRCRRVQF